MEKKIEASYNKWTRWNKAKISRKIYEILELEDVDVIIMRK